MWVFVPLRGGAPRLAGRGWRPLWFDDVETTPMQLPPGLVCVSATTLSFFPDPATGNPAISLDPALREALGVFHVTSRSRDRRVDWRTVDLEGISAPTLQLITDDGCLRPGPLSRSGRGRLQQQN